VLGEIAESAAKQAERALAIAWARPKEPKDVRRCALESLAYAADPEVHDLIGEAYDDDDDLMRQSAVLAMGRSADQRWSRPVLAELRSSNAGMRVEAAVSAGELGLTAAVQRLVSLIDDSDSSVREAAAIALGKIGGREAKRALEVATHSRDERLAQAAEDALDELTFGASGLDEGSGSDGAGALGRRMVGPDEADDEAFDDEDEDDARLSEEEFLDNEDSWDLEDDEAWEWYEEDEEEDEDFSEADSF
jgi:hypothetical protein